MSESKRPARSTRSTQSTYDRALDLLELRARSVAELRRALVRKGEPPPEVDAVVERLLASGLLDDASFARQFARSKALGAGHSRRRIQQELAKRGVARDVSATAIETVFDDEAVDEGASIERLARKKLRTLTNVDEPTLRRRLYAFLARRGYASDDIQRALRHVVGEPDGE